MNKLKVILIGAGNRGTTYIRQMHALPEMFEVVAVAEPIEERRMNIQNMFDLPDEMCFDDWKPLLALGKIADLAVIATMDRDHFAPTMEAINQKYDLLLEKPIAPEPEECIRIAEAAEANDVKVVICTVLRYTPIFNQLKDMIDSGKVGRVISINHEECVGNIHQSHSFIRGKWGNSKRSSSMLLQKSCHDMDILQWLIGKKCKKVQSFGALTYFCEKNAPEGSPKRCIEGCPAAETCHYNAVKLYLEDKENIWFRSVATKLKNPTDDDVREALTNTRWGDCVFHSDNDVVDHQTVNLLFEDDITITFTMNAFNKGGRNIHIMGTEGEIRAGLNGETPISYFNFTTRETEVIGLIAADGIMAGHGGGDAGIVRTMYDYFNGTYTGKSVPDIRTSCYNHMITFAAEESRLTGQVVDFDEYIKKFAAK